MSPGSRSGGYLPVAATLTTDAIYESFLGPFDSKKTFFHGHSYTGNPLACAAALASLRLFDEERTLAHVRQMSPSSTRSWIVAAVAAGDTTTTLRRRTSSLMNSSNQFAYLGNVYFSLG